MSPACLLGCSLDGSGPAVDRQAWMARMVEALATLFRSQIGSPWRARSRLAAAVRSGLGREA